MKTAIQLKTGKTVYRQVRQLRGMIDYTVRYQGQTIKVDRSDVSSEGVQNYKQI